jgi:hypothetical protein
MMHFFIVKNYADSFQYPVVETSPSYTPYTGFRTAKTKPNKKPPH